MQIVVRQINTHISLNQDLNQKSKKGFSSIPKVPPHYGGCPPGCCQIGWAIKPTAVTFLLNSHDAIDQTFCNWALSIFIYFFFLKNLILTVKQTTIKATSVLTCWLFERCTAPILPQRDTPGSDEYPVPPLCYLPLQREGRTIKKQKQTLGSQNQPCLLNCLAKKKSHTLILDWTSFSLGHDIGLTTWCNPNLSKVFSSAAHFRGVEVRTP